MSTILVQREGAICEITLNRPESLNVLNPEMTQDLWHALSDAQNDEVRCVVLKAAGQHFMAGGDIRFFSQSLTLMARERHKAFKEFVSEVDPLVLGLSHLRKPVIAAVHGAVAGFGVSLSLLCDFVVAADDTFFNLAYINLGTSPDGSSTYFLPRVVGLRKAKQIAMLGERIDAQQAFALDLVTQVVPRANLDEEVKKLAERLANGPTFAYGHTKSLLQESFERSLPEQLAAEAESFASCAGTEDFAQGVQCFLERKPTKFKGI